MTSCAATTTIRERVERGQTMRHAFDEPSSSMLGLQTAVHREDCRECAERAACLAALALLEQLVEAAQAVLDTRMNSDNSFFDALDGLAAAVAAVGPGQGLIVGKHPKTGDGDTVALHD